MGYRGEDVPDAYGNRGRQQPWQPSSGSAPGNASAWDDRSQGYSGDDSYPAADDGGYGYGSDGGYPGQGRPVYGRQDDSEYGDPYAQPYGGYGPQQGQGGNGGPRGRQDDYEYDQPTGYEQSRGYDQPPVPGYGSGAYPAPNAGYGRSGGYPTAPPGGYSSPRRGGSGAYPALPPGGTGSNSGAYPATPGGTGGYPATPGGTGGYPAQDAGNDWYGGQPAAAKGASFADTGSYALNGRVIDEYGTGPRGVMRDPGRGFPPGPGRPGTGPAPVPARRALPAAPTSARSDPQPVAETRQQQRLDEPASWPSRAPSGSFRDSASGSFQNGASGGFGGPASGGFQNAASGGFRGPASGGFPGTGARDTFDGRSESDDYQDEWDDVGTASDPYQDRFDGGTGPHPHRSGGRGAGGASRGRASGGRASGGGLSGKRLLYAALAVVAVGIIGVAAYVFVLNPSSASNNSAATGALPTGTAEPSAAACDQQLGTYCHIETAADDPKPLTVAELFPPAFTDPTDKMSYSLVSTKLDTTCANAVVGQTLINALTAGKCTQVVRASYVSGDGKIMGTIGVVNLSTTNEAHYAGKDVGENDFITPLTSKTGVASKLGNGTGVVGADFKGHYLILTWSEYVNGTVPTTKALDAPLDAFSNDVVNETANIALTQRMVTGAPATAATPTASPSKAS
jgi:hypothetical protein